jgi:glycosyltransferase involved in cell wall biosynthesis
MRSTVVIEGVRALCSSYSIVNQNQLMELKKHDIDLFHVDLPTYNIANSLNINSGFDKEFQNEIFSIPTPAPDMRADIVYRISHPYRYYPANSEKLFVFGTSEYQKLSSSQIFNGDLNGGLNNKDLRIITPSNWSKQGFLKAGFDESRVCVVPHGINETIYKPVPREIRDKTRQRYGIPDDCFAILSVGAMTHNKGIDFLIAAYALLRQTYPHIKLILKDLSALYNIKAELIFDTLSKINSKLLTSNLRSSIVFITDNMNCVELNELYGAADCYVSPYRAEGFNLPPLEAAASGTPILVTKGGATDDYCHSSFALQIEGTKISDQDGTHIRPDFENLFEQLRSLIEGKADKLDMTCAARIIKENHTWSVVVNKLMNTFMG